MAGGVSQQSTKHRISRLCLAPLPYITLHMESGDVQFSHCILEVHLKSNLQELKQIMSNLNSVRVTDGGEGGADGRFYGLSVLRHHLDPG